MTPCRQDLVTVGRIDQRFTAWEIARRRGGEAQTAIELKNIGTPDETRTFEHGKLEAVTLSGMVFGKATFEPGWRWSRSVKPIAGTDSCRSTTTATSSRGRMHVLMDDGSEGEASPGDVVMIPPGHDAWTVGDEPCVVFDFSSQIAQYAIR